MHQCSAAAAAAAAQGGAAWTDAWRLYEEVCIVCAGLWIGSWRGNSTASYSSRDGDWGAVQLDGDDDLTVGGSYMRSLGNGIEGRPVQMPGALPVTSRAMRRSSGMSVGKAAGLRRGDGAASPVTVDAPGPPPKEVQDARRDRQVLTTLALLQTFHAQTGFLFSRLATFVSGPGIGAGSVALTPRDVLSFDLGPLSSLDAKFLEWLGDEYGGGVRVVIRKGWRDLFGLVFGFGG